MSVLPIAAVSTEVTTSSVLPNTVSGPARTTNTLLALSSEMNSTFPVGSKLAPVGSREYPRSPSNSAALLPHAVPVPTTVPSRWLNQMFTLFQPAPVVSSTSESTTTNRSDPGIHATPAGSGDPGIQPDVAVVRTSVAVSIGTANGDTVVACVAVASSARATDASKAPSSTTANATDPGPPRGR